MKFSQRIGKTPVRDALQIESMDSELRNSLWNVLHTMFLFNLDPYTLRGTRQRRFFERLWRDFFKEPVDNIPKYSSETVSALKDWFFDSEWYEVYDLIEFTAKHDAQFGRGRFGEVCNTFLEREMSGYRFVDSVLVKITNENELAEIEAAIQASGQSNLNGVKEHLGAALSKLADRKQPDYRNSIKESISAVESISKVIAADKSATLGQTLKILEAKLGIHPALKSGFSNIYGYTSDEDGIRHALMDVSNCDFEDAKYMLVSCSAFINYLISKASKAGVHLN